MMDEERYRNLVELAQREGVSVATLIRRAVDATYGTMDQAERRRRAGLALLATAPIAVPETVEELEAEIASLWDAS